MPGTAPATLLALPSTLLAPGAGSTETPTPAPTRTTSVTEEAQSAVTNPCVTGDGSFCGLLRDVGVGESWARTLTGYGDTVLQLVLIVVVGLVARYLLHKAIGRLAEGIASGRTGLGRPGGHADGTRSIRKRAAGLGEVAPLVGERRQQRARTIGSVLKSITTGAVAVVVVLMLLGVFGINLAPLIAGAGVVGVAVGFGSQALIKDFLSGIFMIVEDQYGVGDVVDVGEATGAVEAVGLRVTRLRSVDGTVWYVRNGEILRVGNQSQGWARAVLDIGVAYHEDVVRVQDLLRDVGRELFADADWGPLVLEEPEVWGVEALSADSVVVRLVVKTAPLEQWRVAREARRRIKATFDREGVEIPFPQRAVWMRTDEPPAPARDTGPERHEAPPRGEADVAHDTEPDPSKGL